MGAGRATGRRAPPPAADPDRPRRRARPRRGAARGADPVAGWVAAVTGSADRARPATSTRATIDVLRTTLAPSATRPG